MKEEQLPQLAGELGALVRETARLVERMGVQGVTSFPSLVRTEAPPPSPPHSEVASRAEQRPTLEEVRARLGDCRRCRLSRSRHNIVFGEGEPKTALVFVGEGPGADEDRAGRPFVGAAGRLLDRIIRAIGLEREQVYICNIVKCRPPQNRNPEPDEISTCLPFVLDQLEAIGPKVVVALGRIAARALLDRDVPIGVIHGKWQHGRGLRIMPVYHPAALLRDESKKRPVWEAMKLVKQAL